MAAWWYASGDKKVGPVDEADLQKLFVSDRINANTLVWSEGMTEWVPLHTAAPLSHLVRALPPELPPQVAAESALALADAGPWRRFFARIIDLLVLGYATGYSVSWVLAGIFPAFAYWVAKPGSEYVFGWLVTPLVLVVELGLFAAFGTTLGKWLLGVRVVTVSGARPSWQQYLTRQAGVYWYGLATGFPFVNLFAMARQRAHLLAGRQATYDQGNFVVKAPKLTVLRGISIAAVLFGLFVLQGALNADRRDSTSAYVGGFDWTNPDTGVKVSIPRGWVKEQTTNELGQVVDLFSNPEAGVTLVFASEETAPNMSVDFYAAVWSRAVAKDMNIDFPSRMSVVDGKPTMRGAGTMTEDSRRNVEVVMVRRGNRIWRVVAVGLPGRPVSIDLVDQVRATLLQSLGPVNGL